MNAREVLIHDFYSAFQKKDYKTMQASYRDDATFSDPVFKNLTAGEVRAMWEMLIKAGKDLQLEFKNISVDGDKGTAEWTARYTFSLTGKKVVNNVKAEFIFKDGKILLHRDRFDFYTWAKQALGFTGLLLGHTSFLKNKISTTAALNLKKFMVQAKA